MSNTAQSGVLNLLSSQIVSIKKQILDPSTYTETAEELKWAAAEEEIKAQINKLLDTFKDEVIVLIDNKTSVIFKYKGNVATVNLLPKQNNEIGDVYNVEDTGANYAWNGTEWDKLSETLDLSKFLTNEQLELILEAYKKDIQKDIIADKGTIAVLNERLVLVEDKLDQLKKTNTEVVDAQTAVNVNDSEKDFIVAGTINEKSAITGKSVTMKDTNVNAAVVNITAGDVDIKDTNLNGAYDKATQGNTMISVHSNEYVTLRDCIINATGYNGLEIGLTTGNAKNILIDNVKFEGKFNNNAISIFGTADNAVITISNCHFKDVSNAIRLSNRTNTKATINIINCVCDKWVAGQYAGLILCEDYTSGTAEREVENNLFGNSKIKINIQNLIKPDGTRLEKPENIADICGSGNNQIIYVYGDKQGLVAYDENKFPVINII